jgi:hypothetical protein
MLVPQLALSPIAPNGFRSGNCRSSLTMAIADKLVLQRQRHTNAHHSRGRHSNRAGFRPGLRQSRLIVNPRHKCERV